MRGIQNDCRVINRNSTNWKSVKCHLQDAGKKKCQLYKVKISLKIKRNKEIFETKKDEGIFLQQTCTIRNSKGNSLGGMEMIPE